MTLLATCETPELVALSEARTLFWTLRQLTLDLPSNGGRSHLFELHQLATRGMAVLDELLDAEES